MKVSIIGSGLSGLTAGALLAQAGHEVAIFEQYHQVGGVTALFERNGFRWDLGQLLVEGFGPGEPVGQILAELGIADKIRLVPGDRGYVFPDFEIKKPAEFGGIKWRIQRLKELFPDEAKGLDRYWEDYVRFTRLMTAGRRMDQSGGLQKLGLQAGLVGNLLPFWMRLNWSADRLMNSYFKSEKLKCVFTSILADFFTPPSQFQGLGVFQINGEGTFDCRMPAEIEKGSVQLMQYHIQGGANTLVQALASKIRAGDGKIFTNCSIKRILVSEGRVKAVEDRDGNRFPAEVVIASGGARETFFKLVGEEFLSLDFSRKVHELPLMESVFMVHLGVDFDPSPYLHGPVTYFYGTYEVEKAIQRARQGVYHEGKDGFVVHVPSLVSPEMAPAGQHAMTIYTICPDRLGEGTWESRRKELADRLVECAEQRIPGLSQHIKVRVILTPADFRERTLLDHHAFGGLAPLQNTSRVPHQTPIQGLWFVGAQSESGGGVNAVIPGAYKTAKRILK